MSRKRRKRRPPVRLFDAPTADDRRTGWYVVPQDGNDLYVVHADVDGHYDTDEGRRLDESEPWHWIAKRLLDLGGEYVEVPWNDLDGQILGANLKASAYLMPGRQA